ncbi:MAG TPA: alcohol dehydrogenase catalytic domain-containing protein [Candidatus Baltobacterales bacterium]|nr:alcohol dehydrogenase catalytic domain-containing protein [Candidatus Baltobacterales bacterium]
MQALVFRGPTEFRVEEREIPQPGPGEALVHVEACGICGTDLRIAAGVHRAYLPGTIRVPGHEFAGTLVSVGDDVGLSTGRRVFIAPNIGCGTCAACRRGRVNLCVRPQALGITRDGGFAEYVLLGADLIQQGNVLPLPDDLDAASAALAEPLACVLRGSKAARITADDLVVIFGAGPIGLLHVAIAALGSPRAIVVVEPNERRRERSSSWGATHLVDPTTIDPRVVVDKLSDGVGADAVIVAAPVAAAQRQALELAGPGGRVNFFGGLPSNGSRVELDTNLIHYKELIVTGTSANTNDDCREALNLARGGKIDLGALVTARFALPDAKAAFAAASSGEALKVVIEP